MNIYLIHTKNNFVDGNNNSLENNSANVFILESNRLQESISYGINNLENLQMEEIVGLYFQVINVSSIAKSLRENKNESEKTLTKIEQTKTQIDEKFNLNLHPLLMSNLEKKIDELKRNLKIMKTNQDSKTKNVIEEQAKKFEELRQLMSTQEFVNQYNEVLDES